MATWKARVPISAPVIGLSGSDSLLFSATKPHMSEQCQHSDDATTFDAIWRLLSLHEQFDHLSLELGVHQSGIRCLVEAYVQQNNASWNRILAAGENEFYGHSTQLQEIGMCLAAIDGEFDVLRIEQLSTEAKTLLSLICDDNQQEDATNSRCEDVERLLCNFIRGNNKDVHQCSSRMIARKDLINDLEKGVPEKVEIMKTTAQMKMEAALRARFQQQRYAFIVSMIRSLETAYNEGLASASADLADRISIKDDARCRIERLRDQLEDLTINAERLAQEWVLDENRLRFTLNCLRQTKDALLLSTRVTLNDDREKEVDELRRQRAILLIRTCKGNATLLSLRQVNKRIPKAKSNLGARLVERCNLLS